MLLKYQDIFCLNWPGLKNVDKLKNLLHRSDFEVNVNDVGNYWEFKSLTLGFY